MVRSYLDELEFNHPLVNSEKFIRVSHSRWACKELLRFIKETNNLPFELTSIEILNQFSDKMKSYAYLNSKNSIPFAIAAETSEYLLEECWKEYWKKKGE